MLDRKTRRMRFRIGINQGDVTFDHSRVYGDGVNVAAHLENLQSLVALGRVKT